MKILGNLAIYLMFAVALCPAVALAQESGAAAVVEAPAAQPAPVEADADAVAAPVDANGTAPEAAAATAAPEAADPAVQNRLTLARLIELGGVVLWVIMGFGFVAVVLTLYLLLTLTPRREVPKSLLKRTRAQIRAGDLRGAFQMCQERDEFIANVLAAGLKLAGHDRFVIQEAMESEGERGATALWQRISYLNNIAALSPLLGLLGTVWGMILAFNAIAYDSAQAKSISMAASVSTAMITTAAGLIVAIPALSMYFYFRGRVIKIVSEVEAQASEFVELIARHKEEE
ncbi:MAG: MotA/TolQ/ExbB proton channel family protein [Candidatus Hydrogenedentes bacterium]|nr:MotA/TolQ/ExbB proton channel family protein [Candidatus Hydrogenedentota bacterium]